jgi:NADH-quinone oxidoreductase subunit L
VASIPALASLLVAGTGILIAFMLYGRAGAKGQQVSWDAPRGVRAFLFNRWYQDNLYEKVFPVGFTLVLMKVLAWFDQNIIDGVVNGVATVTIGISRFIAGFDTYVVDGLVNLIAGLTQFLGLIFRQFQTGRIQTYVVYVVIGVVILFLAFR